MVSVYANNGDMFEGSDLGKRQVYTFPNNNSTLLKLLPPTESAYEEHLRRAALAFKPNVEPCEGYGWTVDNGYMMPVQSTRQAWPQQMMHTISCGFTKGCSRNCSCAKKNIAGIYSLSGIEEVRPCLLHHRI